MDSVCWHFSVRHLAPRFTTWLVVLSCWVGVAVSGCSSGGNTPTVTPQPVVSCTSDEECASIQMQCDLTRRECVCTSDLSCSGATPYCNVITGRCVEKLAGCTSTSCGDGQFCDASTRECKPLRDYCDGCEYDAQCGTGNRCIKHPDFAAQSRPFCGSACGPGDSCPEGQECRDTEAKVKQCVPRNSLCTGPVLCTPDAFTPCQDDGQCSETPGQRCDSITSRCVARENICSSGQACDPRTRSCVPECTTDDQCKARLGSDFICLQRACRPANECSADEQCSLSQFCLKDSNDANAIGRCTATCQADKDCPIGKRCTAGDGGRKQCVSACSTNEDCLLTEICNGGACEPGRCQIKEVCAFGENCISNTCVKEPGTCALCPGSGGCPGGGQCSVVAFNENCGDTTCPAGSTKRSYADSSVCPNSMLYYCTINRCLTPCGTDAECPNGFSCTVLPGGSFCSPAGAGQYCITPP